MAKEETRDPNTNRTEKIPVRAAFHAVFSIGIGGKKL
jgi:hypothetical protein